MHLRQARSAVLSSETGCTHPFSRKVGHKSLTGWMVPRIQEDAISRHPNKLTSYSLASRASFLARSPLVRAMQQLAVCSEGDVLASEWCCTADHSLPLSATLFDLHFFSGVKSWAYSSTASSTQRQATHSVCRRANMQPSHKVLPETPLLPTYHAVFRPVHSGMQGILQTDAGVNGPQSAGVSAGTRWGSLIFQISV